MSSIRGLKRGRRAMIGISAAVSVGMATVILAACAQTPLPSRPNSVAISWVGDCDLPAPQTYYSIDLSSDGNARFTGVQGVKAQQVENLTVAVDAHRARTVMNRLRIAVGRGEMPSEMGRDCLLVKLAGQEARFSIDDPEVRDLHALVNQSGELRKLICPAHRDVPMRDHYCAKPAISMRYRERDSCRFTHTTELYADGTAHYYVLGPSSVHADQLGHVDSGFVRELEREIASMPLQVAGMRVFRFEGEDAAAFRDRLHKATKQNWYDALPVDATCISDSNGLKFPILFVALPQ